AHGSIGVLSKLTIVPCGDTTVEQPPERTGHALRLLLERGPHPMRGAEIPRVARVEEVRIERRAPALALFLEHLAQVVRERLELDQRDGCPFQHGNLLRVSYFTSVLLLLRGRWTVLAPHHAKLKWTSSAL